MKVLSALEAEQSPTSALLMTSMVNRIGRRTGKLVERLDKASTAYGNEISAETKLMTNNTSGINTEIKVNGQMLETVTSFKYLGSIIADEGFSLKYFPG